MESKKEQINISDKLQPDKLQPDKNKIDPFNPEVIIIDPFESLNSIPEVIIFNPEVIIIDPFNP